jgi:hypothetical protein
MVNSVIVPPDNGGFSDPSLLAENTIRAAWTAENGWRDADGQELPSGLVIIGRRRGVRRWQAHELVAEYVDEPLPNVDELNAKIPEKDWELGLDGKKQKPFAMWFAVYLLEPTAATVYAWLSNSTGGSICYGRISSQIQWMQRLRGNVWPIVELSEAPMPTKRFGIKRRPAFVPVEWVGMGGQVTESAPETPALEHKPAAGEASIDNYVAIKTGKKKVKPAATTEAELNDEIPI